LLLNHVLNNTHSTVPPNSTQLNSPESHHQCHFVSSVFMPFHFPSSLQVLSLSPPSSPSTLTSATLSQLSHQMYLYLFILCIHIGYSHPFVSVSRFFLRFQPLAFHTRVNKYSSFFLIALFIIILFNVSMITYTGFGER